MSSIEEAYSRAMDSSRLQHTEFHGDVDVLLAMGYVGKESFVGLWLRTRKAYDAAMAALPTPEGNVPLKRMWALESIAVRQTLEPYLLALRHFALQQAKAHAPQRSKEQILRLVGRIVDRSIDEKCNDCGGKGRTGAYGGPMPLCSACNGSGSRKNLPLSDDPVEDNFGHWLTNELADKQRSVLRRASRKLQQEEAKSTRPTTLPAFGDGLPGKTKPACFGAQADIVASRLIARVSGFGDL